MFISVVWARKPYSDSMDISTSLRSTSFVSTNNQNLPVNSKKMLRYVFYGRPSFGRLLNRIKVSIESEQITRTTAPVRVLSLGAFISCARVAFTNSITLTEVVLLPRKGTASNSQNLDDNGGSAP